MNTKSKIRRPVVAGTFYPADMEELRDMILNMLKDSGSEQIKGDIIGIISPHAGYIYSGKVAAEAYKQVQSYVYDNVIVIAPSHFEYFYGCSIYYGEYETPLGVVNTNIEMAEAIVANSSIILDSVKGHMQEHSLEVQIPFLQIALGNFKLIPVVMGSQDYSTAEDLSTAICTVLTDTSFENQSNLIIGS
ncbi:MAG: AmmeMemoRadiSam system protein B, partial [Thermodesulfobacteriota bacterium]